jgi:hypothetical protein
LPSFLLHWEKSWKCFSHFVEENFDLHRPSRVTLSVRQNLLVLTISITHNLWICVKHFSININQLVVVVQINQELLTFIIFIFCCSSISLKIYSQKCYRKMILWLHTRSWEFSFSHIHVDFLICNITHMTMQRTFQVHRKWVKSHFHLRIIFPRAGTSPAVIFTVLSSLWSFLANFLTLHNKLITFTMK